MNDITRPALLATDDAASPTRMKPVVQSLPRPVMDPPGSTDIRDVRLTRRTLDRLDSVVALGLILVAPRSALVLARLLGPRIPPLTSTSVGRRSAATRRQEVSW
jgi:hypothetical protein